MRHLGPTLLALSLLCPAAHSADGATGLAGPVLRQARTADRRFVGRQILRFLHEDFGVVGTVEEVKDSRVRLQLQGGAVPTADIGRWVPAGSVFALVWLRGDGST